MRILEAQWVKSVLPRKLLRLSLIIFSFVLLSEGFSPDSSAAPNAKLIFADLVLGGFTNGQDRVAVIVNLIKPSRALQAMDWNSVQSMKTLREANKAAENAVLGTLAADEHKVRFQFDNQAGFSCEVTEKALQKLLNNPNVESIEPVHFLEPHLAQGIPLMNALATRSTYNGTNMAIAICDTGIDYDHPRLGGGGFPNSKVIGGYDFGDNDADPMPNGLAHGTACAGIAAGELGTVGDYIGGVAPGAKLYALKIVPNTGSLASDDAMVMAWNWCITHKNDNPAYPIMVISTSFGKDRHSSTCDDYSTAMTAAANNAVAAGITVLASSGNDGFCDSIAWPACISSVISVGAVYDANFGTYLPCVSGDSCAPKTATIGCATGYYATDNTQADHVTSYSNVADFLDVFAPADKCYTTDIVGSGGYSTGDYDDSFGGTSAACPYAAGAVACLQQAAKALTGSYLTPAAVRATLAASGDLVTDTKVAVTKPRVNLGNAINALLSGSLVITSPNGGGVYQRGRKLYINWTWNGVIGSNVKIDLLKSGAVNSPITPSTYNSGFYTWDIPSSQALGTDYRVRISSTSTAASDSSDADFTITNYAAQPSQIQIGTLNDLQLLSRNWGDSQHPIDGYYVLTSDIDAGPTSGWEGGLGFNPIGNGNSDWFRGVFDGQGYKITRLWIMRTNEPYAAVFKVAMNNAVIKNLSVEYNRCWAKGYNSGTQNGGVGGIVGESAATILNCHVSAVNMRVMNGNHIGGIVGDNQGGTILGCSLYGSSSIYALGSSAPEGTGGIAGLNGGHIRWCWVENANIDGNVSSSNGRYVGGIVGWNSRGSVVECGAWPNNINGQYYVGGIVGWNQAQVSDCYFKGGQVSGQGLEGGAVGVNDGGTAVRCYASCSISGSTSIGGLGGRNYALIQDSYWNTDRTSLPAVGEDSGTVTNCFGRTTAELQQSATFVGWDFSNVWSIAEGVDLPTLRGVGHSLAAPTGVKASSGLADGVHIAWNAVAEAGFYQVLRSDATDGPQQALTTNWVAGLTFVDSNAVPSTTFYYWVTAASTPDGGRESTNSASASGSRIPPTVSIPQNVVASDGLASHVVVDWSPVPGANFYQVYRSDTLAGVKTALSPWQPDISFSDASGNPGTTYYYWVKAALDNAGGSASDFSAPDSGYFILPDSVGDGIPDWWRAQYFGGDGTTTNNLSCASCDPDGDSQNNLAEFLAGTNPTNSGSALRITAMEKVGGDIRISFTSVSGRYYCLDRCDFIGGAWTTIVDNISGTNSIRQAIDISGASRSCAFYRVRLNQSPNPALADSDGDGIPDFWMQLYFAHPTGSESDHSRAGDDPDGDGMSNHHEYLTGTNPTNSASAFRIVSVAQEGNDIRVMWSTGGGRTNVVEAALDLNGSYSNISENIVVTGSGDTSTNYLDPGAVTNWPTRFYRIKLITP